MAFHQQQQQENQGSTTIIDYLMDESPDTGNSGPFDVLDSTDGFKDFLIFRVDTLDDVSPYHRELAGESALESEAESYAILMDEAESRPGIHYEVRYADTGALIYTTEEQRVENQTAEKQTAEKRTSNKNTRTKKREARENTCQEQQTQLRMAIS